MNEQDRATSTAFSLYQKHVAIVDCFARKSNRTRSNAAQVIISEWAEQNPEKWLTIEGNNGNTQPQTQQETSA